MEGVEHRVAEHQHPGEGLSASRMGCNGCGCKAYDKCDSRQNGEYSYETLHSDTGYSPSVNHMARHSRRTAVSMLAGGFVAFLAAPIATADAFAGPQIRAGDVCKKLGRRRTVGNKTFECVEKGGVRQWQRAKAQPKPSQPSTDDVKVLDSSALAAGATQVVRVTSGGRTYGIALTRTSSGVVAFDFRCTHAGAFVQPRGTNTLWCPAHDSEFNASTGAVIQGPASRALTQYKASERSGAIYITL